VDLSDSERKAFREMIFRLETLHTEREEIQARKTINEFMRDIYREVA
jgi:hypothetical protein